MYVDPKGSEEEVHSPLVSFGRKWANRICEIKIQDTHPAHNLITIDPLGLLLWWMISQQLPKMNQSEENAILITQTEIACLNNLSLEGDIPDNVSDTE
jgi:hypothetical protein